MNVKSEEIINFANIVCRMCFRDYFPSKVCDVTIVKMVGKMLTKHVDQIVDQIKYNPKN